MEIRIQIEKNLILEEVVGTSVCDDNDLDTIIGEVISYDTISGIAICNMYKKSDDQNDHRLQDII
jgi:hypothetical protein